MTKRAVLASFVLAMLFAGAIYAEDAPHNGFWWSGLSESFKLGYISGYVEANGTRSDHEFFRCIAAKSGGSLPEKYPGNAIIDECRRAPDPQFDYTQLRFGQLEEGLDEFYKDFRNKSILISAALSYVRDQLRGTSDGELAVRLQQLRKAANNVNH
ncbi:MAG: hypothetical protein WBP85_18120 [Terracidiphilus sp.]